MKEEKFVYYFAYGSNMNPERMRERGVRFKENQISKAVMQI
ncbi:MAG: hypothetical protein NZ530_06695 [Thermodesulfobacteriaceae bacterium]|nr:hypothetical protein [Thermodesulfobacteriaceae bacterium]MDW8136135.1 hypothetical protein [Thermodesulfobacterium sp.]